MKRIRELLISYVNENCECSPNNTCERVVKENVLPRDGNGTLREIFWEVKCELVMISSMVQKGWEEEEVMISVESCTE